MSRTLFNQYSSYEDSEISSFHRYYFWDGIEQLSKPEFRWYLIQLGLLSVEFVNWLQMALLAVEHRACREVLRKILRDEIPGQGPTHQENRLYDMEAMGIKRRQALATSATDATTSTKVEMYRLINPSESSHRDLRIMIGVRVFGEILVGETYRHVVPEMKRRFRVTPAASRFYAPHMRHDAKANVSGHSRIFDNVLHRLIDNAEALAVANNVAHTAVQTRVNFHSQFVSHLLER